MGNDLTGTITIGNLDFKGVKVLKSETKTNEQGEKLNCVWTDAGYFEYKDQPLEIASGGNKFTVASAIAAKQYAGDGDWSIFNQKGSKGTFLGKSLTLHNISNGKFVASDSDEYVVKYSLINPKNEDISGVGIFSSTGDGRNYSTFTVDMRNGKKDRIYKQFSDTKVLMDDDDTLSEKKVSDVSKGSTYEYLLENNKNKKYDR